MAAGRKVKKGLNYFQLEVTFFSDIKIRKAIRYAGANSISVYVCILGMIYRNGYYLTFDEDLYFIVSEETGINEEEIEKVFTILFKVDLLSKEMFANNRILTSKGIQERYQRICDLAKRKSNVDEFNLIDSEEIVIPSEETPIKSETIADTSDLSTHKKRKDNIIKNNIIKEESVNSDLDSDSIPKPDSFGNYKSMEDLERVLLSQTIWQDELGMAAGIENTSDVPKWVVKFFIHAKGKGSDHKTLKDAKSHCLNWIRNRIKEGESLNVTPTIPQPKKLNATEKRSLMILNQRKLKEQLESSHE